MDKKTKNEFSFLIEAIYELTVIEQKTLMFLALQTNPEDNKSKKYQINLKEFAKLLQLKNQNDYSQIQESVTKLLTRVFTIETPEVTVQIKWLSSVKYFIKQEILEVTFDPELRPFFLQLKEYFINYKFKNAKETQTAWIEASTTQIS